MYDNESWNNVLDEIMLHYNFEFTYGVSNDIQKQFCQSNYNCSLRTETFTEIDFT